MGLSNSLSKFKNAELWFKLHPKYWGKGYETALAVLKFGFEELVLYRLEAGVATENIAPIKVLIHKYVFGQRRSNNGGPTVDRRWISIPKTTNTPKSKTCNPL
ncbi:MAG: N-acetyltransferase [Chryseobacterium sp.]|nr:MAG: N-acetyltransferase [Chryseobacterium sp.]